MRSSAAYISAQTGRPSDLYKQTLSAWTRNYEAARHGTAEIYRYTASWHDEMRGAFRGENVRAGARCTRLLVKGELMMSDTPDEYRDHIAAINHATGRVLINGLGLGCYLAAVLVKPEVRHVDVVEINPDVLHLVAPHFAKDERVVFHSADAYVQAKKWPAGSRWDCVWHDIWPDKCIDDLAAHAKLHRSYARRAVWQGAWAHEFLLYRRGQEKRAGW